jgi:hypothetical protein
MFGPLEKRQGEDDGTDPKPTPFIRARRTMPTSFSPCTCSSWNPTCHYVDNGKNLPLWRELPEIAFWFLPSAIGVPLILYVLLRHPLVLGLSR